MSALEQYSLYPRTRKRLIRALDYFADDAARLQPEAQ
jgi:hypothetical protein